MMSVFYPLYYRIYRIPLGVVFLLMGVFVLLWSLLAVTAGKRFPKIWKTVNAGLFLFIVLSLLYFTVLRRPVGANSRAVFTPFASLQAAKKQPEIYRALTMNIFLFFPVGLFASQLLSDRKSVAFRMLLAVLIGLVMSLTVETMQYFFLRGMAETDDLITNALGTLIGALTIPCTALFKKIAPKR